MHQHDPATCGCCGAEPARSPRPRNRPGRTSLDYRAGTYGSFLVAMQRALSRQPGLRGLSTRDPSDPAIALLDAWAAVGDVLAFQTERVADEGFLRTARHRDSVALLARAIGYELRPGVAASTHLALSADLPPDGPDEVTLAAGVAVQSVPGPDEDPQVFETVEPVTMIRGLDDLRPARVAVELPAFGSDELVLDGTATGLSPGDMILVVGADRLADVDSERWDMRRVAAVEPVEADPLDPGVPAHTVVRLDRPLGHVDPRVDPAGSGVEVHALRRSAPLFGHAAPPWSTLPVGLRIGELHPESGALVPGPFAGRASTWADAALPSGTTQLELARTVDGVVPDSWAVIGKPTYKEALRVTAVEEANLADFMLTAEGTVLTVEGEHLHFFTRRNATVWCASAHLPLGGRPLGTAVAGEVIDLAALAPALAAGRTVIVEGVRVDTGARDAELATVAAVETVPSGRPDGGPTTRVRLTDPLGHAYVRDTVHVRGNVVGATHGETRRAVLGSGDGTRGFQRFVLPEQPLTHTADESTSGARSTLEVRVDGVAWEQVATLHGQPSDARVYTARARPADGRVEVTFGDGVAGARLPSGQDNVVATYRVGVGLAAQVAAEQLSLLASRPYGLSAVRNPLPARGAADPEPLGEARRNAPAGVRTLDRVVSLADVTDVAATYAGVAKARAAWLWVGEERTIHVTVAPADGGTLDADDPLLSALARAIDGARHPGAPVVVAPHVVRVFTCRAGIVVEPAREADEVLTAAREALLDAFSFDARGFAEPVAASEVAEVLHAVAGVVAVDLDALHRTGDPPERRALVPAPPARVVGGAPRAATLLTIDADALELAEVDG